MWPRLAMMPRTPEPGATSLPSSSSTAVFLSIVTRGPPVCDWPFATMLVPPKPVSEEPIESVMMRLGSSSRNFSLMLVENSAAVLASRNSERQVVLGLPCSWWASSASSSGRAIASPVKNSRLTLCSWIIRQTSSALNSGASTTVWPENSDIQVADCVAPWIIGGIGSRIIGGLAAACLARSYSSAIGSPVAKSVPPNNTR